MIWNPVVTGNGAADVTYHVENDPANDNIFYPTEARPGQYVVNPSCTYSGMPFVYDETGAYKLIDLFNAGANVDDLPPKVREVLESAPATLAPPMGGSGYLFFVMPEENVKIITE